jgi:hypothetical protein
MLVIYRMCAHMQLLVVIIGAIWPQHILGGRVHNLLLTVLDMLRTQSNAAASAGAKQRNLGREKAPLAEDCGHAAHRT